VFESTLIDAASHLNHTPGVAEQDDPPVGSFIDFSKGMFEQTQNPLDVAVDNQNGFFVVRDEAGTQYLTRAGHFILTPAGEITTTDGKRIDGLENSVNMGKSPTSGVDDLKEQTSVNIVISPNGDVFANNDKVGFIQIAKVDNPETLQKASNACFTVTSSTKMDVMPQEEVNLKQGWLENSNVDIVKEMVQMIELQRLFEVGSKVIHTGSETLDTSLRLGRIV